MDAAIRLEFALSADEYVGLLDALRARLGLTDITDITCLSAAQLASIADRWEAAAVARLAAIVAAHVGVEKLHRAHQALPNVGEPTRASTPEEVSKVSDTRAEM
jgi:hypothetical protein